MSKQGTLRMQGEKKAMAGRRAEVWRPGGGADLRQVCGQPIHSSRRLVRALAQVQVDMEIGVFRRLLFIASL